MIYRKTIHERVTDEQRGAWASVSLTNQLTISSRLIEHEVRAAYRSEGTVTEDWPRGAGQSRCPWLPFVHKQLQAIQSLPDGWDSYGAPRPDARLVTSARGLIECLAEVRDLPQPHVNPTPHGGVQLEWEVGPRYFELEIVAERAAEYLYCDDAAHLEETGSVFEQESLELIVDYIRRIGTLP